jgi:hypothetical protein
MANLITYKQYGTLHLAGCVNLMHWLGSARTGGNMKPIDYFVVALIFANVIAAMFGIAKRWDTRWQNLMGWSLALMWYLIANIK